MLLASVGSLESFEPGDGATVAKAATEFGNGMILSSVSHPGLEATAEASGDGFCRDFTATARQAGAAT